MMVAFWIWLPLLIYSKSKTFKDQFIVLLEENHLFIETEHGKKSFAWREFHAYFETPGFFHLYFDSKTFFLIPKDAFYEQDSLDKARALFRNNIGKSK
jgi:hypothetical protein